MAGLSKKRAQALLLSSFLFLGCGSDSNTISFTRQQQVSIASPGPSNVDESPTNQADFSLRRVDPQPLFVGATTLIQALELPGGADATNSVTWSSSDSTIANVDGSGLVTANSSGQVAIIATRGDKTHQLVVTVLTQPTTDFLALQTTYSFRDLAYGLGRFVAAGQPYAISSLDGATWVPSEDLLVQGATFFSSTAVCFGDGRFVAGNFSGGLSVSNDGLHWTPVQSPTTEYIYPIHFLNGSFYALASHEVLISPDGENWTKYPLPNSALVWNDIAELNGRFVAVGSNQSTPQLSEIATWTEPATMTSVRFPGVGSLSSVYSRASTAKFVAAGAGFYAESSDGRNWIVRDSRDVFRLDLIYKILQKPGSLFEIALGSSNYIDGAAAFTENAQDWFPVGLVAFEKFSAAAFGGGQFLIASDYGTTASSVDGREFQITNPQSGGLNQGAIYGNGRLVTSKVTGVTTSSQNDGATWEFSTQLGDSGQRRLTSPVFLNNRFYVIAYLEGTSGTTSLFSSPDGLQWSKIHQLPYTGHIGQFLGASEGKLFVGNGEVLEYSADGGESWNSIDLPISSNYSYAEIRNVVFDGQKYWVTLGGGLPGTNHGATDFFSSPDLLTWTLVSQQNRAYLDLTAWNGRLLALSYSNPGTLLEQTMDGIQWTQSPLPGGSTYANLRLIDSEIWLSGPDGIFHSSDLQTWTTLTGPPGYVGELKILANPHYYFGIGSFIFARSVLHR